jgi:hypothetical protein
VSLLALISENATYIYLAMPVYYFASLKNVYQQSWPKTIAKGVLIGSAYFILGICTIIVIMTLLLLLF